jgi:hypothetical protein
MIRQRKWASLVSATVLMVVAAGTLKAQGGPGGTPTGPGFRGMGPDEALGFVGFEGAFAGKTVTDAPFSADFSTETTEVLSDGNKIDNKSTGTIARDGSGRTRRELTLSSIGGYSTSANGGAPAHGAVITDPVAGVSYVLNENKKDAHQSTLRTNNFRGNGGPNAAGRPKSPNVTTESLGTQMIGGISAEGTRITHTIPAGQIGNEKAIVTTVERWYSPDLQTNVMIKRTDPRGGTTVFQLTNVVRAEPDSSLFQVPSGYTVVSGHGPGGARGMARRGTPPPPPQQ